MGLEHSLCARPPAPPDITSTQLKARPVAARMTATLAKVRDAAFFFLFINPEVAVTASPDTPTNTEEASLRERALKVARLG